MTPYKKLSIFVAVLLLLIPFAIASAQSGDVEISAPENLAGTYVLDVSGGSFAEAEDGDAYILTLEDSAEYSTWLIASPLVNGGRYETSFLVGDWAAAPEGAATTGVLTTETQTLVLQLSQPEMDEDGTIRYLTEVLAINPLTSDKEASEMPTSFGEATLFITVDAPFALMMQEGFTVRMSIRFITSAPSCTPMVTC